ncbi:hypothetical protein BP6252_05838 [Coleophoma cylindrospora]|uniref:Uncharacterized protein n=1 Tax=Coleophoma cylindrospora TaxID=1849047 RepID=A0A3D8RUV3_9HELO|nr:hypothetical protein BP6252_05838 [Coleophoma cylindrospora]
MTAAPPSPISSLKPPVGIETANPTPLAHRRGSQRGSGSCSGFDFDFGFGSASASASALAPASTASSWPR